MNIEFRVLASSEAKQLKRFYKQSNYSPKVDRSDEMLVGTIDNEIVAGVRLQPKPDGIFLRAMVVAPALRGQGIGHRLLDFCVAHLASRYCYCYALTHLRAFYERQGFVASDVELAKPSISEAYHRLKAAGRDVVFLELNGNK